MYQKKSESCSHRYPLRRLLGRWVDPGASLQQVIAARQGPLEDTGDADRPPETGDTAEEVEQCKCQGDAEEIAADADRRGGQWASHAVEEALEADLDHHKDLRPGIDAEVLRSGGDAVRVVGDNE